MRLACLAALFALLLGGSFSPSAARPKAPAGRDTVVVQAEWDSLIALQSARRYAVVDSVAQALIARIEASPHPDTLDLTHALSFVAAARYSQRLVNDGKAGDAIERLITLRARHVPPGEKLMVWAEGWAARYFDDVGQHDKAYEHARGFLDQLRAQSPMDTLRVAAATRRMALALHFLGRESEAREQFLRAIEIARSKTIPTWEEQLATLGEYGQYLSDLGEFDAARDYLNRAREIGEHHKEAAAQLDEVFGRLTTLEQRVGNLADAVDLAQRSYELTRVRFGENAAPTLRARVRLAYRISDLGDHAEALRRLREIAPVMAEQIGRTNPQVINVRISALEDAAAVGDTTGMRAELAALWPIVMSTATPLSNATYLHAMGSVVARLRGDERAAWDSLEVAVRGIWPERTRWGGRLADLASEEAVLLAGPGDRDRAEQLFARIDTLTRETSARAAAEWPHWLESRAGLEARLGLADSAWTHALQAASLQRERLRYQAYALSDHQAVQLAEQSVTSGDVLDQLASAGDPARAAAAWEQQIRWRGLVREEVTSRRLAAWQAADTAVAGAHARWLAAQRSLAQLVVSGAAHPDDPATAERFAQARAAADAAEQQMGRAVGGASVDTVTLTHVLSHLSPRQALVGFATAGTGRDARTLGAFVAVAGGTPRWVTLGDEGALGDAIAAWTAALATPPSGAPAAIRAAERACRAKGAVVREKLWAPVLRALGDVTDVFVVPEASTWNVPWLALPVGEAGYVADAPYVVHLLNAERELLRPSLPAKGGLLAVGDPDFDLTPAAADTSHAATRSGVTGWPCADGRPARLESLPAARAEVQAIAALWPVRAGASELRVGNRADEADFKREAPGRAVIHLATHGIVLSDTCVAVGSTALRGVGGVAALAAPSQSPKRAPGASAAAPRASAPRQVPGHVWLAFAGANHAADGAHDENEGLLTAEEVATLDLAGTDWVVLSACHSGEGETWLREGQSGMRRAFHLAGVRTVIASRWAVADAATREWMVALYRGRSHGLAAAPAVRAAAREVLARRRTDGRSTHPFFWAGFEASGR